MGKKGKLTSGQKLTAHLPGPAECRLILNGNAIDSREIKREYSWPVQKSGVYRLECYRSYLGKNRGWIFSNPIWLDKD